MSFDIFPKGTIYHRKKNQINGVFVLRAKPAVRITFWFLRTLGSGLIGFFIISFLYIYYPLIKEEALYRFNQKHFKIALRSGFGELLITARAQTVQKNKEEAQSYGLNSNFSLIIPKIGAKANILANISIDKEKDYLEALKEGVAHTKGTGFPGEGRTIFLFAHSTDSPLNFSRYNAVFYLLNKLEVNDRIFVFFADQKYLYEVFEKKIVEPNDTSWLENNGSERLILQTCYPPGTTLKRLLILAKKV